MNTITFLTSYWHLNVTAIIIIVLMLLFHLITNRFRLTKRSVLFFSGVLLFLISTLSPIEYLARFYLYSAQMVRHIMLLLIIPPLLLAGTDKSFLDKMLDVKFFRKSAGFLFYPVVAWLFGVGSMWAMHSNMYMTRLMRSPAMMNIEMILLPLLGLIFIWPVFTPTHRHKLDPLASSLYLFLACVGCTLLGILITFVPSDTFRNIIQPDNSVVLQMIRNSWGISWRTDQIMGGLIMWVPACIIYLAYIMIVLMRWLTSRQRPVNSQMEKL